jgi:ascorbate-specific PTS system EIIC-type component UlaA
MMLEGGYKATLPIPEISGRLKIFVELCWILGLIDHHGVATMLSDRDSRLFLSCWLKDLS